MLKKNTGLQGSTLSGPRMTTGFGPFELHTPKYHSAAIVHVRVSKFANTDLATYFGFHLCVLSGGSEINAVLVH